MSAEDCIFCKIADGRIPTAKVFEDDICVAFNDLSPQAPTHILLIPKTAIPSLAEVRPEEPAVLGQSAGGVDKHHPGPGPAFLQAAMHDLAIDLNLGAAEESGLLAGHVERLQHRAGGTVRRGGRRGRVGVQVGEGDAGQFRRRPRHGGAGPFPALQRRQPGVPQPGGFALALGELVDRARRQPGAGVPHGRQRRGRPGPDRRFQHAGQLVEGRHREDGGSGIMLDKRQAGIDSRT